MILDSIILFFYGLTPLLAKRYKDLREKGLKQATGSLEEMFVIINRKKLVLFYALSPVILGAIAFILFAHPIAVFIGIIFGFSLPSMVLKIMAQMRRKKFQIQLIDALTSLSQSLKAGLSLLQAMEVLVEEMPPPLSEEFGLIIKENKMGKKLEESFEALNKKMDFDDLNLMTTAILVARETGGNLTDVFSNLANTIRQKRRIADQVTTLTTQARWQGIIMSALPVVFAFFIFNLNPDYLTTMLNSNIGRMLLLWCVVSELIGAFLLNRLSRIDV